MTAAPLPDPVAERSDPESRATEIRILGGDPTPEELAAVTAVLSAALDQLAAEERRHDPGITRWERTQRRMREPLQRGAWAGFGH